MSLNSQDKNNRHDPFAWTKLIWIPLSGFLSGVTVIIKFIQLWQGDQSTVTVSLVIGGLFVLVTILLYIGFKTEPSQIYTWPRDIRRRVPQYPQLYKFARYTFAALLIFSLIGIFGIYKRREAIKEKFVILVANFDEPTSDNLKTTELLLSRLKQEFSRNENIIILASNQVITEQDGSQVAKSLGRRYLADIVLWGWYTKSATNVIVTLHLENLMDFSDKYAKVDIGNTYEIPAPISNWESFEVQSDLSSDIAFLVYILRGLNNIDNSDYTRAVSDFNESISVYDPTLQKYFGLEMPYYMRGISFVLLAQNNNNDTTARSGYYEKAADDFTFVINNSKASNNNNLANAYYARALTYLNVKDDNAAEKDYYNYIDLVKPLSYEDFMFRGHAYSMVGFYKDKQLIQKAIDDFTKALALEPNHIEPHFYRGVNFLELCELEKGRSDLFRVLDEASDRELRLKAYLFLISPTAGCPRPDTPAFNEKTPLPNINNP